MTFLASAEKCEKLSKIVLFHQKWHFLLKINFFFFAYNCISQSLKFGFAIFLSSGLCMNCIPTNLKCIGRLESEQKGKQWTIGRSSLRFDKILDSSKLLCMSSLPESFKHEKDQNFHSRPIYNTTGIKWINNLSLCVQANLFKKSKLSVPGDRIVFKFVKGFQEGFPGTSVAKSV